ncbi:S-adenosyl-L-methionine-dependent methyltransferase [Podospora appendiculata]|uniref:S-adenosyl-L-methionine-dependent methyltransferase n=1 Tax=Podospora appendiculata TaxID=314037 RepID=A0AAE0XH41_9PEZI|nr:S-adenosyl-L-methionine-dependent methyltransferase [Podospora appendiculata]
MAVDFDKQSYWHKRFSTEASFEWLVPSAEFMPLLDPYLAQLPSSAPILHLGIGTSDLHTHIRKRGFENLTNIDYEPLAIDRGCQLEQDAFGNVRMKYLVADATQLDLGSTKYDLVVDKGTADAIACGGDEAVAAMTRGVAECLAEGGVWVSLSYSAWRYEIPGLPFDVDVASRIPLPKARETDPDLYHYCYLLRAKGSGDPAC